MDIDDNIKIKLNEISTLNLKMEKAETMFTPQGAYGGVVLYVVYSLIAACHQSKKTLQFFKSSLSLSVFFFFFFDEDTTNNI